MVRTVKQKKEDFKKKKEEEEKKGIGEVVREREIEFQPGKTVRDVKVGESEGMDVVNRRQATVEGFTSLSPDFENIVNQSRARRGLSPVNPAQLENAVNVAGSYGMDVSEFLNLPDERRQQLSAEFFARQQTTQADRPEILDRFEAEGGFNPLETRRERGGEALSGIGGFFNNARERIAKQLQEDEQFKEENVMPFVFPIPIGGISAGGRTWTASGDVGKSSLLFKNALLPAFFSKAGTLLKSVAPAAAGAAKFGALGISAGAIVSAALNISPDNIVDKMLKREDVGELQSQLSSIGQTSTSITGMVEAGGMSADEGVKTLENSKQALLALKHKIQQAGLLDDRVFISDEYGSALADLEDQLRTIDEQQTKMLNTVPQYDEATVRIIMDQLRADFKDDIEELRAKGYLDKDVGREFYGG